ncbi:DUF742 domain-containing protein [Amycolatopsis magusensis]|uniref:DUF742 domain-containing protein n=2 Tax=Amycolatopsis magusensis TaxID=882444 RepID=A0ABS4Q5J5_9PSEU|nr:DUF742 domain-containing protein [Amycolatopsis magusensis]MBP2186942.1 hypothetical protein [Amycolatopsis magusensis]UJW35540.1 DUF742 domain-containing protein [Saccharothrix sp. AJ9571]
MTPRHEAWFDDPLVRPYAVTGGRTRSENLSLDLITLVVAMPSIAEAAGMDPEYGQIVRLCQRPISVAEVAARVDLPLPVVKVLLCDLIEQNLVLFRTAAPLTETPNKHVLQAVLDGIRKL